jgi:hypothetical protein
LLLVAACSKTEQPPAPKAPKAAAAAPAAAPGAAPAAAGPAVDIAAFCAATMAGKNPAQCYGKDRRSERLKTNFCIDVLATPLRAGKVTVDPAKLAACEQAVLPAVATLSNQRSVTTLAERFPACRGVFTGKLAAGAECIGTMECAPGLVCNAMKCETPGGDGDKCRPVIELTMAVVESSCASGLHCSLEDYVCMPKVAKGAACVLTEECQDGLSCRDSKCVPAGPAKHDEGCDEATDCPAGDFCNLSHRCETLRADGEKCLLDSQCQHQCVDDGDSVSGFCGPCTAD